MVDFVKHFFVLPQLNMLKEDLALNYVENWNFPAINDCYSANQVNHFFIGPSWLF